MPEKIPHPMCSTRCGPDYIDDGTLCLSKSCSPQPTGTSAPAVMTKAQAEEIIRQTVCEVAKQKGLHNITDEGGVIKYRGRLYPCFWDVGLRRSELFKTSTLEHEKQHIKDAEKYGYYVGGLIDTLVNSIAPLNNRMMRVKAKEKVAVLSEYLAFKKSVDVYEEVAKRRKLTPKETSELEALKNKRDEFRHKFEAQ
jgi:hypothetical protein